MNRLYGEYQHTSLSLGVAKQYVRWIEFDEIGVLEDEMV